MSDDKYLPGVDIVRVKDECVKNKTYSSLLTSDNYVPKAAYSDFDVLGYVKKSVSEGGKVLFFPEFRVEKVNRIRINREKHERAQLSRELVGSEELDLMRVMEDLGFKKNDDDSVFLNESNAGALTKLLKRRKEGPHHFNCMVVVNKRIYNIGF